MSKKNPNQLAYKKQENMWAYIICMPILAFHFLLIIVPSFSTLYASFTQWSGVGEKTFIGFQNYVELYHDPVFKDALMNNIRWMIFFLTVPIITGFVIGYMLSTVKKYRIFYRAVYFLPYVISAAIAGKIFSAFYNPYFGINLVLEKIGLEFLALDWLSPKIVLYAVAFVDNWHWWGFVLVIFMSALQQIDPQLYEVANVEGANTFEKLRYVTFPSIKQTIIFIVVMTMVWSLGTFTYVWVMTKGGPGSEILSTMLYKNSLFKYKAGYASAIAMVQVGLSFAIFTIFSIVKRKSEV